MTLRNLPLVLGSVALLAVAATAAADCSASHSSKKKEKVSTTAQAGTQNIVEVAVAAGSFQTLVTAVKAAGLAETLSGPGPFTVFAPTDAAFAALPAGTVEGLLADKAALTRVLTYHVVAGEVLASALPGTPSAATVEGSRVTFSLDGGQARINGARIVTTDIRASNGVIHVIDAVILPPAAGDRS
jgi:uncharacterized surface protein with fasciclin (FAS1) repeats